MATRFHLAGTRISSPNYDLGPALGNEYNLHPRVETLGYKFAMPTALFSFQLPCFQTSDTRQLLTATREKKFAMW
ncbi:hypothetical protein SAMN06265367_104344 [Algoriphagus winogradskyi]|uniref:Uncharacterized protein n=1 Tax=Algoriphagus winogradskyi TaxID=237017 RepID=A0ABY1P5T9_9BACT|nr:hypothetical protein SAMN06265367_104344 [Algoriphagus winogradskyi]